MNNSHNYSFIIYNYTNVFVNHTNTENIFLRNFRYKKEILLFT